MTLLLPALNAEPGSFVVDAIAAKRERRTARLLLVDDRDDLAFIVSQGLQSEGFQVTTVSDLLKPYPYLAADVL